MTNSNKATWRLQAGWRQPGWARGLAGKLIVDDGVGVVARDDDVVGPSHDGGSLMVQGTGCTTNQFVESSYSSQGQHDADGSDEMRSSSLLATQIGELMPT